MVADFNGSIDFINLSAKKDFDLTYQHLLQKKLEKKSETLQHYISDFSADEISKQLETLFDTPEETAWLTSLKDPDAGAWLEIAPKTKIHSFTNTQFEMALSLRLRLPQKCIVKNIRCSCSTARKIVNPDIFGIHFCSGCNKDGVRIQIHDRMRDQIET